MRRFATLVALLTLLPVSLSFGAPPAAASDNFPARIDLPNGFFPEGIESGPGTSFFVGSISDGVLWEGDFRTGTARDSRPAHRGGRLSASPTRPAVIESGWRAVAAYASVPTS